MTLAEASSAERRRWRRYLAAERREEHVYHRLAARRQGEEREILLSLAEAELRHQQHWLTLLDEPDRPLPGPGLRAHLLVALGRLFGPVLVLALAQRAEARSPYEADPHASEVMAADERIHGEVVRALAERSRNRISGTFRAAIFGLNDGLVSNSALILGVVAAGMTNSQVLITGVAGLLAGALSMAAGEYVSVRSQRELLEASRPDPQARKALPALDVDANELALVYRARGESAEDAESHARRTLASVRSRSEELTPADRARTHEEIGTGLGAASASFAFFAAGAIIPVLPYLLGLTGVSALVVALSAVGLVLLVTGGLVGLLSGTSPWPRALRQLAIGFGAALATYLLGLAFGVSAA